VRVFGLKAVDRNRRSHDDRRSDLRVSTRAWAAREWARRSEDAARGRASRFGVV